MGAGIDIRLVPDWYNDRLLNDTFPGLAMYARDTDLTEDQVRNYVPGRVFRTDVVIEAAANVEGLSASHRFLIMSNRMVDLSASVADDALRSCGICGAKAGSRFKVLDVQSAEGKTQITLLHLPDDERWNMFDRIGMSIDKRLCDLAREKFESKLHAEPVPGLQCLDWSVTCAAPVGFDRNWNATRVDVPLANRLAPLHDTNFRRIAEWILYIENVRDVIETENRVIEGTCNDALAFGYIDDRKGLCVHFLCMARQSGDGYTLGPGVERFCIELPVGEIEHLRAAQIADAALTRFAQEITEVHYAHNTYEHDLWYVRRLAAIDACRDPYHPDRIEVLLSNEDDEEEKSEEVWARTTGMQNGVIYASLIDEPSCDFGLHAGDGVDVSLYQDDDGGIICGVVV